MLINSDFSKRVVLNTHEMEWMASPAPGVERRMLDRLGAETGHATSVVRYTPDSSFPDHVHGGGEEFFVLEGKFSDREGDYAAGTYVRNPPGSKHAPYTKDGCVLFVKLCQFADGDTEQKVIDTNATEWSPGAGPGVSVMPLHSYDTENVALVRLDPGTRTTRHAHPGGEEIFVLEGVLMDEDGEYPALTWIRNPVGSEHTPFSDEGSVALVKTGHLPPVISK